MKKRCGFVVLFLMMALFLWTAPAMSATVASDLTITEEWGHGGFNGAYFTVNTTLNNIEAFAVGNDQATDAFIDSSDWYGTTSPPPAGWVGTIAYKGEGNWYYSVWEGGGFSSIALTWLDGAAEFDSYASAFLFYGSSENTLSAGFTDGFCGSTEFPMSPFAAHTTIGTTITGETSAVPIPGAVWLLGSGIMGMMAIRRRKETV